MQVGDIRVNVDSEKESLARLRARANATIVATNVWGVVEGALDTMSPFSWFSDARYLLGQSRSVTEGVEDDVRRLIGSLEQSIDAYAIYEDSLVQKFKLRQSAAGESGNSLPMSHIGSMGIDGLPHWPGFPHIPVGSTTWSDWLNSGELSPLDVLFIFTTMPGVMGAVGLNAIKDVLKDLLNDSGALVKASNTAYLSGSGDVTGTIEADVLGWELSTSNSLVGKEDGIGLGASIKGEASLASLEFGLDSDVADASAALYVGKAGVKGSVKAPFSIDKEGNIKFDNKFALEGELTGDIAGGEVSGTLGSDDFNLHGKAEGSVGHGELKGVMEIGADGVGFGGSAKASLYHGEAKTGFSLFGISVDAKVKGDALGVGAEFGILADESSAQFDIGAALGLGAGVSVSVDWSNANLPSVDDVVSVVGDIGVATGNAISSAAESVGSAIGDGWNSLWSWIR